MATSPELKTKVSLNVKGFRTGLRSLRRAGRNFSRNFGQPLAQASANLAQMGRRLGVVAGILATFGLKQLFDIESLQVQFETLLGSTDEAKKRIKNLIDFSASTPFKLKDVASANRTLEAFGGAALSSAKMMTLVGDAAAGGNQKFSDVAFWVGRMFAAIKGGQPFGEASTRLMEMTILSGDAINEMKRLSAEGASADKIFSVLIKDFSLLSGGMERLSKTGFGLLSTALDNISLGLAALVKDIGALIKVGLGKLISTITRLRNSGDLEKMGQQMGDFVRTVVSGTARIIRAWQDTSQASRDSLKKTAAISASFIVLWRLGFIAPFVKLLTLIVTVTATQLTLMLTNFAAFRAGLFALSKNIGLIMLGFAKAILVPLAAIAAFLAGLSLGRALENAFDVSGALQRAEIRLGAGLMRLKTRILLSGTELEDALRAIHFGMVEELGQLANVTTPPVDFTAALTAALKQGQDDVESAVGGITGAFDVLIDPVKEFLDQMRNGAKIEIPGVEGAKDLEKGLNKAAAAMQNLKNQSRPVRGFFVERETRRRKIAAAQRKALGPIMDPEIKRLIAEEKRDKAARAQPAPAPAVNVPEFEQADLKPIVIPAPVAVAEPTPQPAPIVPEPLPVLGPALTPERPTGPPIMAPVPVVPELTATPEAQPAAVVDALRPALEGVTEAGESFAGSMIGAFTRMTEKLPLLSNLLTFGGISGAKAVARSIPNLSSPGEPVSGTVQRQLDFAKAMDPTNRLLKEMNTTLVTMHNTKRVLGWS